jgi:hypothetical protein
MGYAGTTGALRRVGQGRWGRIEKYPQSGAALVSALGKNPAIRELIGESAKLSDHFNDRRSAFCSAPYL